METIQLLGIVPELPLAKSGEFIDRLDCEWRKPNRRGIGNGVLSGYGPTILGKGTSQGNPQEAVQFILTQRPSRGGSLAVDNLSLYGFQGIVRQQPFVKAPLDEIHQIVKVSIAGNRGHSVVRTIRKPLLDGLPANIREAGEATLPGKPTNLPLNVGNPNSRRVV